MSQASHCFISQVMFGVQALACTEAREKTDGERSRRLPPNQARSSGFSLHRSA